MFYVSTMVRKNGSVLYGVLDTEDGVVDYLTKPELLDYAKKVKKLGGQIHGVSGNTIKVVSMTGQVMDVGFAKVEKQIDAMIASWSIDTCMEVARQAHFVRQIKGKPDDEVRRVTKSYVYPSNIREAVQSASKYTNHIREIPVTDRQAVLNALMSGLCLVLQQKSDSTITCFVCTASLAIVDQLYVEYFLETAYLMKQLYKYTYGAASLRPRTNRAIPQSPDAIRVFSGDIRFRNSGVRHDGGTLQISSPFYGINFDRLFCVYALDNPCKIGNTLVNEYTRSNDKSLYEFDFDMYMQVCRDVGIGADSCFQNNAFSDATLMAKLVDLQNLHEGVTLADIIDRYQRDFNYMKSIRASGTSIKAVPPQI